MSMTTEQALLTAKHYRGLLEQDAITLHRFLYTHLYNMVLRLIALIHILVVNITFKFFTMRLALHHKWLRSIDFYRHFDKHLLLTKIERNLFERVKAAPNRSKIAQALTLDSTVTGTMISQGTPQTGPREAILTIPRETVKLFVSLIVVAELIISGNMPTYFEMTQKIITAVHLGNSGYASASRDKSLPTFGFRTHLSQMRTSSITSSREDQPLLYKASCQHAANVDWAITEPVVFDEDSVIPKLISIDTVLLITGSIEDFLLPVASSSMDPRDNYNMEDFAHDEGPRQSLANSNNNTGVPDGHNADTASRYLNNRQECHHCSQRAQYILHESASLETEGGALGCMRLFQDLLHHQHLYRGCY